MIDNLQITDLEVAPPTVVRQAAYDFAAALVAEPEYRAHVAASSRLELDSVARSALDALQSRQQALQAAIRLNAVSPEEQPELDALREAFVSAPAVVAFVAAESKLKALCQAVGSQLSQSLGIDFAGACSTGCC